MPVEVTYRIARNGRATNFVESEIPLNHCAEMKNRFVNSAGGAEKRQGMSKFGNAVSGTPTLTGLHELVGDTGGITLFTSGEGAIYRYDDPGWTSVFSGWDSSQVIQSVQFADKLIFFNGKDRPVFTTDGSTFKNFTALHENGDATAGTGAQELFDSDIDNWVGDTNVAENDIVHYLDVSAFGVVNAVATASVGHTRVDASAAGIGAASATPAAGDRYEIIDTVELNIIPTTGQDDNTAVAAAGTSAAGIKVSSVANWTATQIRIGDFIRNTTRTALTEVTSISTAQIGVVGITGQTSGDSLVFLADAMPIPTAAHVHFRRLYMADARDESKLHITAINDSRSLKNGTVYDFGNWQPDAGSVQALTSFQQFIVIGGRGFVIALDGINPISQSPVAQFPQGVVSHFGMLTIGNDAVFVNEDGLQSFSQVSDATQLQRSNLTEPIREEVRAAISAQAADDIRLTHYRRRSWVLMRVGTNIHCYNYTPFLDQPLLDDRFNRSRPGSWSLFTGKFAEQKAHFVRESGQLLCAGSGGQVYEFDDGTYGDDTASIATEYKTGHLNLAEPKGSVRTKQGHYIKPVAEVGVTAHSYTIRASAAYSSFGTDSSESITVAVSGSVYNQKQPLRWRGEVVQIAFETDNADGPDALSKFTLYATEHGRK